VLPLLRLRWVLLNNPSFLRVTIHRMRIIVLQPPSGPWNAMESPAGMNHEYLFFLAGLFFLSHGQRKEGSRGGGILTWKREKEQEHTGTVPAPQLSQNTFPEH